MFRIVMLIMCMRQDGMIREVGILHPVHAETQNWTYRWDIPKCASPRNARMRVSAKRSVAVWGGRYGV